MDTYCFKNNISLDKQHEKLELTLLMANLNLLAKTATLHYTTQSRVTVPVAFVVAPLLLSKDRSS